MTRPKPPASLRRKLEKNSCGSQPNMFLIPEEVISLTGKSRRAAQVRALTHMGIEHTVRPDGKVIVLRSHVEKRLDGNIENKVKKRTEPDWNAINA